MELRAAVSEHREIDEVQPAFIHTAMPKVLGSEAPIPPFDLDEQGRLKMPAFLLSAHKA